MDRVGSINAWTGLDKHKQEQSTSTKATADDGAAADAGEERQVKGAMEKIRTALQEAREVGCRFAEVRDYERSRMEDRVTSLGDSTLIFLDDDGGLYMVDLDAAGGAYPVPLTAPIEGVEAVAGNVGRRLIVATGPKRTFVVEIDPSLVRGGKAQRVLPVGGRIFDARPDLHIVDVKWHPASNRHLFLLTSNGLLWIFNVEASLEDEEQRIRLYERAKAEFIGFTFGPSTSASAWEMFTVYLATRTAGVFSLCPVAPYGLSFPAHVARDLVQAAEQEAAADGQLTDTLGQNGSMQLTEDSDVWETSRVEEPHRRLDFSGRASSSWTDPSTPEGRGAGPDAQGPGASSGPNGATSWSLRQARLRLQWLHHSVSIGDGSWSRAFVRQPKAPFPFEVLVQGPMDVMGSPPTPSAPTEVVCEELFVLDRFPPVLFRSRLGGDRIDILLAVEEIRPYWRLAGGDQEDVNAGEDVAPALLWYEHVELPGTESKSFARRSACKVIPPPPSTGRADLEVLLRGDAGLFSLRMPWLATVETGDPSAVDELQPSVLSALIASGGSPPLGGTSVLAIPEGVIGVILSAGGHLYAAPTAKSMRDWGTASADMAMTAGGRSAGRGAVAPQASDFERKLAEVVKSIRAPAQITPELLDGLDTPRTFALVQKRTRELQDYLFRPFAQLHALITERARSCCGLSADQREVIEQVVESLTNIKLQFNATQQKLQRCQNQQRNLSSRATALRQAINDSTARLSKAEELQLSDYKSRWSDLEQRRQQVEELVSASKALQKRLETQRAIGGEGGNGTEGSPGAQSMQLRVTDRTKIFEALDEHSKNIERAMAQGRSLDQRSRRYIAHVRQLNAAG